MTSYYKDFEKEWYKKGVRILMLIHRKKDGGPSQTDRRSIRYVSRNPKEFDKFYWILFKEKRLSRAPLRIYSSVNARNVLRAIRLFKMQQIVGESQSIEDQIAFYTKSSTQFLSCLSKPQCAERKFFLVDVDDKDGQDLNESLDSLKKFTEIIDVRKTPNGSHVIVKPFNYALTPDLEIKKDAMILLD